MSDGQGGPLGGGDHKWRRNQACDYLGRSVSGKGKSVCSYPAVGASLAIRSSSRKEAPIAGVDAKEEESPVDSSLDPCSSNGISVTTLLSHPESLKILRVGRDISQMPPVSLLHILILSLHPSVLRFFEMPSVAVL